VLFAFACSDSGDDDDPQRYDIIGYVMTSASYTLCDAQEDSYGVAEPTLAIINDYEQWIITNISMTLDTPIRNKTRQEITTLLLNMTSYSQADIRELFEDVDSIGRGISWLVLNDGNYEILFFEKL
jgi:hypothetical protein